MKCLNCSKRFTGRSDAKFCSTACRVKYHRGIRNRTVTDTSKKTILSLCDFTGNWSHPYQEAGYHVCQIDVQLNSDIRMLRYPGKVYGILAAPPCTHFASSGARYWQSKGEAALLEALSIFDACCRLVLFCDPVFWCFENPVGRLSAYIGPPRFTFHPYNFGDAYTKRTCLWGNFTPPKPRNQVDPIPSRPGHHSIDEYWIYHEQKSLASFDQRAQLRSVTPKGFARAFFEVNQ